MNDNLIIEEFQKYLDKVICSEELDLENISDDFFKEIVLASFIKRIDFSEDSKIKDSLKQDLFIKLKKIYINNTELSESNLDLVIAAQGSSTTQGCSLCNCSRNNNTIERYLCPDCGHPKDNHK